MSKESFTAIDLQALDKTFNACSTLTPWILIEEGQIEERTQEGEYVFQKESIERLLSKDIEMSSPLGVGGMGIVYQGQQYAPYREVAVKKLRSDRESQAKVLMDEAMIMGELTHPNIPPIYHLDLDEKGLPEVVMKKIEGKTFEEILGGEPQRDLKLRDALQILIQVCYAVEYAHSQGFLHRDLKPENIMVGQFNQVYLMDWGIAVSLHLPEKFRKGLAGTPAYMAPEMLKGDPTILTKATDVFLLGAILHEIITGEKRHQGKQLKEVFKSVYACEKKEYSSSTPYLLADLCDWACTREAADRPQSVFEFRAKLEEFLEYWEAIKFLEQGQQLLSLYEELWSSEKEGEGRHYHLLHQISFRAKFFFEQAIDIWIEIKEAKEGLIKILSFIIEQAVDEKKFHRVTFLLEEYPELYNERPNLIKRFEKEEAIWKRAEKRRQRLGELEREWDPSLTWRPRILLRRILIGTIVLGFMIFFWLQDIQGVKFGQEELFYALLMTALPVWVLVIAMHKQLTVNVWGRLITRMILSGTGCMVLSRYFSLLFNFDPQIIPVFDTLFLSLAMMQSYPLLRFGIRLSIFGLLLVVLAINFPVYSRFIFYILGLSIGLVVAIEGKNLQRSSS